MSPVTGMTSGDRPAAQRSRLGPLLVAIEPPPALATTEAGSKPAAGPLLSEGLRLALALGVGCRPVTWAPEPYVDAEAIAAAVAEAARAGAGPEVESARDAQPVAVLLADTDLGRQLAPLVAHLLGSGAVVGCSDVHETRGTLVFVKRVYGGWLEREIVPAPGTIPVATLDLTGIPEPETDSEAPLVPEVLAVPAAAQPPVVHLETVPPDPRTVDLVHARRIVAAGSGSASAALLEAVEELAELLTGSVGATRPVVDDGLLPKERLIGQTGRTVSPELYVALGISGSPHHVAGVRSAEKIVSVNWDVRAPIFRFSDVGYVADLEVVLPALVQKIKEWRDARGEL